MPEKIDSYELGAKASFNSGSLRGYFNVAGFWNELKDQQLSVTVIGKPGSGIPGARVIVNAGASRVAGIEVDASVTAWNSLKLDLGYAYLDTILKEFTPRALPDDSPFLPPPPIATGVNLPFSPKHRITATLTYTLPLDKSIGEISLGGTFVHTSTQIADFQSPFGLMPASDLLNLNVNWNNVGGLPVDLAAFVTNVTNAEFPVNVANNWSSNGFEAVVTNVPRMWGFRLKYRFGENSSPKRGGGPAKLVEGHRPASALSSEHAMRHVPLHHPADGPPPRFGRIGLTQPPAARSCRAASPRGRGGR